MPRTDNDSAGLRENRLKNFASFFKGYMSVMPLVTAALAPVLTLAKAIPVFESQRTSLATFSGLFGFLLVAWTFFARGIFVPAMTGFSNTAERASTGVRAELFYVWILVSKFLLRVLITIAPLTLIVLSGFCYIYYSKRLDEVLDQIKKTYGSFDMKREFILQSWGAQGSIPNNTMLQLCYLGIFLSAELAFVLMALREYAYGTLHISEMDVLSGNVGVRSVDAPAAHEDFLRYPPAATADPPHLADLISPEFASHARPTGKAQKVLRRKIARAPEPIDSPPDVDKSDHL